MSRKHTEEEDSMAFNRRRVFALYGHKLAEDILEPTSNVDTAILKDMAYQAKQKGEHSTREFRSVLFAVEIWVLQTNYKGTICMYPYQELL